MSETSDGHKLYKPKDFTNDELDQRNTLAVLVIEGGLGICKECGAAEIELEEHLTCTEYKAFKTRIHNRTPYAEGDCADYRNMNGGCAVCGQPCF